MAQDPSGRIGRLFRRLVPETLGTRLVVTVVLLSLGTTLTTIAIEAVGFVAQLDSWTRDGAASDVRSFSAYLDLGRQELRSDVLRTANDPGFAAVVGRRDGSATTAMIMPLVQGAGVTSLVVLDATGRLVASHGAAVDVQRLTMLGSASPGSEVLGMTATSEGPAFVSGAPIPDSAASGKGSFLIAARAYGPADQQRYAHLAAGAQATIHAAGYVPDDVTLLRADAGDGLVFSYGRSAEALVSVVVIPSVGGSSAGSARIDDRETRTGQATAAAIVSYLLAGIAAVGLSAGLGLWLTRLMRHPVNRMVEHVKTQGYLAAEGAPYSGESLVDDPSLPLEFRELGAVVEDLLRHLAARQSELKAAIRTAGYAEETLGIVVNESVEVKIVLQDGRIVIANPAASVALGVSQAGLLDRTATEAFSSAVVRREDGSQLQAYALLESALDRPTTISLSRPEHPERWYIVQAVRHADDLHNRILVTARDVTEERRLQTIRAEIVSLISHDLRSPLAVVIGYLDLLRRPLGEEDRDHAIESAKQNASRMADLLEDLLSATRAEELLAPSELSPVALVAIVDEIVDSMRPTHAGREISLITDCDPVVLGDDKRLRQAIVNLVTNAYKYAPDSSPIEISLTCDAEHASVRVADHGPGVPADQRARIFERFERLENGTARSGVGLGLYIVQIIAQNHGGSARVEETPGGGATFVIDLPLAGEMRDGEVVLRRQRPAAGPFD